MELRRGRYIFNPSNWALNIYTFALCQKKIIIFFWEIIKLILFVYLHENNNKMIVNVLYDFHGEPNSSELTIKAGEQLTVRFKKITTHNRRLCMIFH